MSDTDKLAAAEAALHALETGEAVKRVKQGEKEVEFASADPARLRAYVDGLRGGRRRAVKVTF